MSRYAFTAMLAVLALSATALIAASTPKPSKLTVQISAQAGGTAANACTMVAYPLKCPSLNCTCVMYTGSFNGTLGHGNLSKMELTLDEGDATPGKNCTPAFGIVSFPAGRRFGAITLDVAGAICNSTPAGGKDTIGGGFDVDPMTTGVDGTGSMTGIQDSGGAARIKLSGALAASSMTSPTATPTSAAAPTSIATSTGMPTATATSTVGLPLPTATSTSTSAPSASPTSTSALPLGL